MTTHAPLSLRDFTHDSPITIDTAEQAIEMTVADVIRWVAPGAPPGEALKFLLTCRTARLNPFLGEAFLVNLGGKYSTIIAKAGYLKRAQEHPDFAGFEAGIILQPVNPQTRQPTGEVRDVVGTVLPANCLLLGGWAKVWRRGIDRPVHSRLSMAEYNKTTATWKSTPCTMIRKTALVHAIREAFAIGDSYDTSEVNMVPGVPVRAGVARSGARADSPSIGMDQGRNPALELAYQPHEDPTLPPALFAELNELVAESGISEYQLNAILSKRDVTRIADLSVGDARTMIARLRSHVEANRVVANFPNSPDGPALGDLPENQPIGSPVVPPDIEDVDGEIIEASAGADDPHARIARDGEEIRDAALEYGDPTGGDRPSA